MEKNNIYHTKTNYSSESVDVIKQCCSYLVEHNFYYNDIITNVNLLEKSLINYSIIKLNDWDVDIEKLDTLKLEEL